jgi:signal transduction histidine kinase
VQGMVQVLAGRDPVPAWRSRSSRWISNALAWLGWAVLSLTALGDARLMARPLTGRAPANGFYHPAPLGWFLVVTMVAAALPMAARYPLLGWRLAYLAVLVTPLIPDQSHWDPAYVMVLVIVFFVAGLRHPRPVLWSMWALMLIPAWVWTGPDWVKAVQVTALFTVVAGLADGTASWRRARRALAAQTERAELEGARRAVLEERTRIAREMHDVVAHHMSMIAVQAETAPYRLSDVPEPVRAEFTALSGAAREALTEMRKLLGVLRSDQPAERVPQPQLADVPELVSGVRRAGAQVSLSMPGTTSSLPPRVGVCAYRIVQESLSNAGRHAPGAAISVRVEREPQLVRLKIFNEPPAEGHRANGGHANGPAGNGGAGNGGAGHGLAGMRERVELLGGSLSAGPVADGGFAVAAVLPVNEAS